MNLGSYRCFCFTFVSSYLRGTIFGSCWYLNWNFWEKQFIVIVFFSIVFTFALKTTKSLYKSESLHIFLTRIQIVGKCKKISLQNINLIIGTSLVSESEWEFIHCYFVIYHPQNRVKWWVCIHIFCMTICCIIIRLHICVFEMMIAEKHTQTLKLNRVFFDH